jgi:hypothetical protein
VVKLRNSKDIKEMVKNGMFAKKRIFGIGALLDLVKTASDFLDNNFFDFMSISLTSTSCFSLPCNK